MFFFIFVFFVLFDVFLVFATPPLQRVGKDCVCSFSPMWECSFQLIWNGIFTKRHNPRVQCSWVSQQNFMILGSLHIPNNALWRSPCNEIWVPNHSKFLEKKHKREQHFQSKGPNLSYFHQSVVMCVFCFLGFAVQSSQENIKFFAQSHFPMKWHHIMQSPYIREYSIFWHESKIIFKETIVQSFLQK